MNSLLNNDWNLWIAKRVNYSFPIGLSCNITSMYFLNTHISAGKRWKLVCVTAPLVSNYMIDIAFVTSD